MNRYRCPACGRNQYTACGTAEGRIYCGHKELEKMETLARRNSMRLIDAVPVVRCGECAKHQSPNCAAKHEQALMDFCSHGVRKLERSKGE